MSVEGEDKNPLIPFAITEWDVSLDTSIVIHLYDCGQEDLLFSHFESLYIYEYLYSRELKRKANQSVIKRFNRDVDIGRIKIVQDRHLKEIGFCTVFERRLSEWLDAFGLGDKGEANAAALAQTLGIRFLATDDEKEFGPYDILLRQPDEGVIPLTFYELLVFQCLKGDLHTNDLYNEFEVITSTFGVPTDFVGRMKRVYRRFWDDPTPRDRQFLQELCRRYNCSQIQIEQIQSYLNHLRT